MLVISQHKDALLFDGHASSKEECNYVSGYCDAITQTFADTAQTKSGYVCVFVDNEQIAEMLLKQMASNKILKKYITK